MKIAFSIGLVTIAVLCFGLVCPSQRVEQSGTGNRTEQDQSIVSLEAEIEMLKMENALLSAEVDNSVKNSGQYNSTTLMIVVVVSNLCSNALQTVSNRFKFVRKLKYGRQCYVPS